jgi:hypothetical protein
MRQPRNNARAHAQLERSHLRENALRLSYADRRVLLSDLAYSLVFGNDAPRSKGSRRPDPADIAENIITGMRAMSHPFGTARGSTASQVEEEG